MPTDPIFFVPESLVRKMWREMPPDFISRPFMAISGRAFVCRCWWKREIEPEDNGVPVLANVCNRTSPIPAGLAE